MDASLSAWFIIVLAACAANFPFLNNRLLAVIPLAGGFKPFWVRLLELTTWYAFTGVLAYLLESRIGNVFVQGWEFYAITVCLFFVLAFPGFVYRYLFKHRTRA